MEDTKIYFYNFISGITTTCIYFIIYNVLNFNIITNHRIANFISYIISFIFQRQIFFKHVSFFSKTFIYFLIIAFVTTLVGSLIISISTFTKNNNLLQNFYNLFVKTFVSIFISIPLRKKFIY